MIKEFLLTLLLFSSLIYSQENSSKKAELSKKTEGIYLADPTIFFNNNTYYLYGTSTQNTSIFGEGFLVYTSKNLKKWNGPKGVQKGLALKKGDAFGTKGFWAPQIFSYNNKFYMAYTANESIAIATSDSPLGPFINTSKKSLEAPVKQIDPFVFFDEDGKKYLYHVRLLDGNRIFVAELNDDLLSIKPETLTECIYGEKAWENTENTNWPVTEGPTVLKHKGLYYLIYSANDFRNPDYAVGYATSKSPYGPWKKATDNPIINKEFVGINGSGHGDVFIDKKGKMNYVLHTHFSNTSVVPRKSALIKILFDKSKEEIKAKKKSFRFLKLLK